MEKSQSRSSVRNLGYRLDALAVALANLEADPNTAPAARQLAAAVCVSAASDGMAGVAAAAARVAEASAPDMTPQLRDLIDSARRELAVQSANEKSADERAGAEQGVDSGRDPLTGLLNETAFFKTYAELIRQRPDPADPIALAMLGIGRFNDIARECGPAARDDLLREVASIMTGTLRTTDIVARWGQSEFVVVLPGEDHVGGARAIEKLLTALNGRKIATPDGKTLRVTVCAGLSVLTQRLPVEQAIENADPFLHAAYYVSPGQAGERLPIVSDATRTVRRTETVALCIADPSRAQVVKQLMERENYNAVTFADADVAIQGLSARRFKLVLIDDELPGHDGWLRLLATVRGLPRYNRVPVAMLLARQEDIVRAMELGANDYIVKPFAVGPFGARIRRVLSHGTKTAESSPLTILVVDHEVAQLLVAGTALHQQGGCRVVLAQGTQDGIRRLSETLPDYLILDMRMPGFTGNDFVQLIPSLPKLRALGIIAASDSPPAADVLAGAAFPIKGWVTRPFKPATFLEEIRRLIPLPEPAAAKPLDQSGFGAEIQRIVSQQG